MLDIGQAGRRAVLAVGAGSIRPPEEEGEAREDVTPWGWGELDLDRGIPFVPERPSGPPGAPGVADGRKRLFELAGPPRPGVHIAYCLDVRIVAGDAALRSVLLNGFAEAVGRLRQEDRASLVIGTAPPVVVLQAVEPDVPAVQRALKSAPSGPAAVSPIETLRAGLGLSGVTHVLLLAEPPESLTAEEEAWLRNRIAELGTMPRTLIMLLGERKATPAVRAVRELAVRSRGAFGWLRRAASPG